MESPVQSAHLDSSLQPCEGKPTPGAWALLEVPTTGQRKKGPTTLVWARRKNSGERMGRVVRVRARAGN